MNSRALIAVPLFIIAGLFGLFIIRQTSSRERISLTTPYQAVILTNGQILYGKLEAANSSYPTLIDVYYVQSQVDPETKQLSTKLIKRGKEWHEPGHTTINAAHILFIEPVRPESYVGKVMAEAKNK